MGPREERRSPGQPRVAGAPRRPRILPPCARACVREPTSTRLGAFVWAFYRFAPAGVIVLVIALFMAFAEKISNIPSSDN